MKFYVYMIGSKVFRTTIDQRRIGYVKVLVPINIKNQSGYFCRPSYYYIHCRVFTVCGKNFSQVVRFLKRNWHKKHKHGKKGGVK